MELSPIEKNKLSSIDLLQMEYFSDLPISKNSIIVIEFNNTIAITIHKFLTTLGFDNIYTCKEVGEAIKIFSEFVKEDTSVPLIIDHESNTNIENSIREILEIQSSAKIIVITTNEKSDSQINRLADIGISAIIHKPLVFDDFKKSLSHVFDKHNNSSDMKGGKDCEFLLTSYNQISTNKIKNIFEIDESEVETMIKNAIERREITSDREVLEAACNQCTSTNINYTAECPQCSGINFKHQGLIEHYDCGEVYPKEENYETCPKCNKHIGSVGRDYRELSEYYVCSSCNDRFSKPSSKFTCLDCGNMFIEKLAVWKKSSIYKIQK